MRVAVALFCIFTSATTLADEDAACVTEYGRTVCGYHCIAEYGQIRCAKTEAGVCLAEYGQIVCWDPPSSRRRSARRRRAECLAEYGRVVCGYGCVAEYGQVKCAQTPRGRCFAGNGQVVCTDEED